MTDRARMDQIAGEWLVKVAHIVLASRIQGQLRSVPREGRKSWFNLQIEELAAVQNDSEQWKRDVVSPLVIEIYLQPSLRGLGGPPSNFPQSLPSTFPPSAEKTLLERWTVQYNHEDRLPGRAQSSRLDTAAIYKRMVIMLRSLCSYVRLQPAYRLYRACKRDAASSFSLQHCIKRSVTAPVTAAALTPPRPQHFSFAPIETPQGFLRLDLVYCASAAMTLLEPMSVAPAHPQIITDYMSSQQGGERPSSLSTTLQRSHTVLPDPSSSPPVSTGAGILRTASTPVSPLIRRHSWSLKGGSLQDSQPAPASQPAHLHPTPASSSVPSQLSRQVHAQQQRQQQQQQQVHEPAEIPFAPSTPGGAGVAYAASTPPKYPSSLTQRISKSPAQPSHAAISDQAWPPADRSGTSMPAGVSVLTRYTETADTAQAKEKAQEAGSGGQGSPGVQRRTSAPVCIPGGGNGRACASSIDLWALGQDPRGGGRRAHARTHGPGHLSGATGTDGREPCSAPATSHTMAVGQKVAGASHVDAGSDAAADDHMHKNSADSHEPGMPAPATPPVPPQVPVLASETSSDTSSYPTSCSPLLPFAFTPSAHSLASLPDHQVPGSAARAASPPMSGKAGPGALALVRRLPSWSLRSSILDLPPPALVGYSVSPMYDSLESSLWSGSTPRHPSQLPRARSNLPSPAPSPPAGRGMARSGSSSISHQGSGQILRLTSRPSRAENEPLLSTGSEDTESDALPFALDAEVGALSVHSPAKGIVPEEGARVPASSYMDNDASASGHVDEEVGAFVRFIQDAKPLESSALMGAYPSGESQLGASRTSPGASKWSPGASAMGYERSLQASLDQLKAFKDSLHVPANHK